MTKVDLALLVLVQDLPEGAALEGGDLREQYIEDYPGRKNVALGCVMNVSPAGGIDDLRGHKTWGTTTLEEVLWDVVNGG